jgi:hypothetical protein
MTPWKLTPSAGPCPLTHPGHKLGAGKLLLMSGFLDVEAEVNIQQEVQAGGVAVVLNEEDTFPPSSIAVTWRGDGAVLATISQAADECAPKHALCATLFVL